MQTNLQGNIAELSVLKRATEEGFDIFLPFGGKTKHDLIIFRPDLGVLTLQVKSCNYKLRSGSYAVHIKSIRPNRTESVIHKFDKTAQDLLAVYIVELDAVVFYKSSNISVSSQLTIGALEAINLASRTIENTWNS